MKLTSALKLLFVLIAGALTLQARAAAPPAPFGPVPTPRQLCRETNAFWGFLHYGVNTFTDREWGNGDEDPNVFYPANFDANQIVRTAKMAGMRGLVLTCKHHDGFCLWPTAYTTHSVKYSRWYREQEAKRPGSGDVVKDISDACRKYGLKFGVYLSPWDRNNPTYATPAYLVYYRNELRELLTHYGPIYEVWFDGANGGSGYYGGANETRTINNRVYYDWPHTWAMVRELQPQAVMFSDGGPDIRWVGNEDGFAGDPCWETIDAGGFGPGYGPSGGGYPDLLNSGQRDGTNWLPAECDVSIRRPDWFYHAGDNDKVLTAEQLLDVYYKSIGRGAGLILNIPPDRDGQIHSNDVASLREFRRVLNETFAHDLARGAKITASNVRGNDRQFSPRNVLDGNCNTYWSTDDSVTNADLVLDLGRPVRFNVVRLREYLPLGQRVETYALDDWKGGKWVEFAKGEAIGNCRLVRGDSIITRKVRVRFRGPVCPAISEVGLFIEPDFNVSARTDAPITLRRQSAQSAKVSAEPDQKTG